MSVLEVTAVELYEGAPLWPKARTWLEDEGFEVRAEEWRHETFGKALVTRRPARAARGSRVS